MPEQFCFIGYYFVFMLFNCIFHIFKNCVFSEILFSSPIPLKLFCFPYTSQKLGTLEYVISGITTRGYKGICYVIHNTGWPRNNGTVDTVDFSGLCINQQLFSSPCWIEHLFPIIITSRSSNLVEKFLFYETFLMDCHFRNLPDFQSFEARWQINGKSQKWQSIRNYS